MTSIAGLRGRLPRTVAVTVVAAGMLVGSHAVGAIAAAPPDAALLAPRTDSESRASTIELHDADSGALIRTLFPSGTADPVYGLTYGPDGALYASTFNARANTDGRVLRIPRPGLEAEVFVEVGSGGLEFPLGLTFGPDGNLYVVNERDTGPDNVLRFDGTSGDYIDAFAVTGLAVPQDAVFGPDGNLHVTNGVGDSVARFDGTTGAFLGYSIASGTGGLKAPIGISVGPDGDLYVASFPTNSILQFDGTTGAFVRTAATLNGLPGAPDTPTDLAFGPTGDLYVTGRSGMYPGTAVYRFDASSGVFLGQFSSPLPGHFNTGMFFVDDRCSTTGTVQGAARGCFSDRLLPAWTALP